MLTIIIFKWLFVFSMVCLSIYHYTMERNNINMLSKHVSDRKMLSELKHSARLRMGHFFLLFTALIIWIMSYDLQNEKVTKEKDVLTHELDEASKTYSNAGLGQERLIVAQPKQDLINDIKSYYTDLFVNYYVMRKCNMTGADDVFIINSAMIREITLNNAPISLRDKIIKDAKQTYSKKFANFGCDQMYGKYNDIIKNYQNYIITVREVLRATF